MPAMRASVEHGCTEKKIDCWNQEIQRATSPFGCLRLYIVGIDSDVVPTIRRPSVAFHLTAQKFRRRRHTHDPEVFAIVKARREKRWVKQRVERTLANFLRNRVHPFVRPMIRAAALIEELVACVMAGF